MKKIKISVFTGKRGGFGALIKTMHLLNKDPYFDLSIIASDMYLSKKFGSTIHEIKSIFKKVKTIKLETMMTQIMPELAAMSKVISGLASILKN